MLFLGERGKPQYPEKTSRSRIENQQTQPNYDAGSRNRTRAKLVEGERYHRCTIPAPQVRILTYLVRAILWNTGLADFLQTLLCLRSILPLPQVNIPQYGPQCSVSERTVIKNKTKIGTNLINTGDCHSFWL